MIVGVPRERLMQEHRVALTPAAVAELAERGHSVLIEAGAGEGSGISDDEYSRAGARIVPSAEELWAGAELVVKVKEPIQEEFAFLRPGLVVMAFLHLAAQPALARALLEKGAVGIAYETIQLEDGRLPCLAPMSEVAGRMAAQVGAHYLQRAYGGRGVLLGGVPGVPPAHVVILGGGTVGTQAARIAAGMGARVTVFDKSLQRLRYLDDLFGGGVATAVAHRYEIEKAVTDADLVIGAALVPGARAPKLVTEAMVRSMRPGAVIVDVAVDQGGTVETVDRATTHTDPVYEKHGVIHYAVANIPGAVPRTSTYALANAILPYVLEVAGRGWRAAATQSALARGFNVAEGRVVHERVAEALGSSYTPLSEVV